MRYAIKGREVVAAKWCALMDFQPGCCPHCVWDAAHKLICSALGRYFTKEEIGGGLDYPPWCPLPSEEPGSGADYTSRAQD